MQTVVQLAKSVVQGGETKHVARDLIRAWFKSDAAVQRQTTQMLLTSLSVMTFATLYRIMIGTYAGGLHTADDGARRRLRSTMAKAWGRESDAKIDQELENRLVTAIVRHQHIPWEYEYGVGALGKALRGDLLRWKKHILDVLGAHPRLFAHAVACAEVDAARIQMGREFVDISWEDGEEAGMVGDEWERARWCIARGNAAIVAGAGVSLALTTPSSTQQSQHQHLPPHQPTPPTSLSSSATKQMLEWIAQRPKVQHEKMLKLMELGGDFNIAPLWPQLVRRVILLRWIHPILGMRDSPSEDRWIREMIDPLLDPLLPLEHLLVVAQKLPRWKVPYRAALARVFRPLHTLSPAIAHALDALTTKGTAPLLTVNYDSLLTQALFDRTPTSHVELLNYHHDDFISTSGGNFRSLFVAHLHGRDTDLGVDRGFALTEEEYLSLGSLEHFLRFLLPLLAAHNLPSASSQGPWRSLLFVGCGGTLSDVHFDALWFALRLLKQHTAKEHFVLCSSTDQSLLDTCQSISDDHGVQLTPLTIPSHDHVLPALQSLAT